MKINNSLKTMITNNRSKKIFFFLLLGIFLTTSEVYSQSIISADYYFDSENGNDNNNGSTPSAAWRTVTKFNSTTFPAGSIIAFRDSMDYLGVWTITESGTSGNPIKITNWYGSSSEKYPRFINSLALTGWTQTAGYNNIWQASATVGSGISAVYFDCGDSLRWGIHRTSLSELTSEFAVYYTGGQIYVYSPTNPSNKYNQVRYGNIGTSGVPATSHGIYINGSSYITIQYIDAAMNTYNGIRTNGGCSNIKVYDCNMYYNGRGTNDNGNGIELVNVTNVEVKRCTIYENSSHGPYVYGLNGTVSSNIIFDSCVVYDNHHTIGFDLNGNGGIVSNITYRNNKIFESDWYPYRIQNPSDYSPANFIASQGGEFLNKNIVFSNNLVYVRSGNALQVEWEVDSLFIYNNTLITYGTFTASSRYVIYTESCHNGHRWEIKNNILYHSSDNYIAQTTFSSSTNLITDSNLSYRYNGVQGNVFNLNPTNPLGTNGVFGNPLFTDFNNFDFTLQSGSPAIDAGATLGSPYNIDMLGVSRPQGSSYDIGVYEYNNGVIIDNIPPQLINAQVLDSITVELEFSELMDEMSLENPNNYAITNGINILNAVMTGNQIRLSTSEHINGIYQVTVNNVTDIAGNLISLQHNSIIYEYQVGGGYNLIQLPVSAVLASVTPEPNHYAEKTLDGNGYYQGDPDSRWAGDTMPEWLVYDFGDVQILNQTKLSFYNWNNGRIYNYSLQVSSDSISWNELRSNVQSASGEWSIEEIGPIEARYIKIIFVANNQGSWAGLWEAQFYGHLKIPSNYEDEKFIPSEFLLDQNYPNPFNPSTKIKVHLTQNTQMRLAVYNMLGELIVEIANGEYNSGTYEFNFDATGLASGMYLYRVESPAFVGTKKMVLLR